jgi:Fe-S cluster assembly ATP-binding protein
MAESLLRIEALSLARGGRAILSGVNLDVPEGHVHALLGPNGSGKSSLAYALMGCAGYAPDAGRILVDGHDITALGITERARLGVTLAWQEPARFEGLSVAQYLQAGSPEVSRGCVTDGLGLVMLPPNLYANRAVDQTLSGGERKRVELAAVFAMRPRLAILDEPDSGIDMLSLADIGALIRRMAREGTTVLLITHRDEMATAADSASLMCQGSILRDGPPAEVCQFYVRRCRPHFQAFGRQPWDDHSPAAQAAPADLGRVSP